MVSALNLNHQLPLWPDVLRGVPNAFARSALFNVDSVRKGERLLVSRKPIAATAGITLLYSGAELRVDDEDVFLQVLHQARMRELGTEVSFSSRAMLKELRWSLNTASTERLIECLVRLVGATVEVGVQRPNGASAGYAGTLVRNFKWKEDGTNTLLREWVVRLEPEIISLFDPQSYTRLDWEMRLSLPPLAKQVHKFYHSHAKPFDLKVVTLLELSGSKSKDLRQFRYRLKAALELLVARGFLQSAHIEPITDLVKVVRGGSAALPPPN